jgi:antitoxin MazE
VHTKIQKWGNSLGLRIPWSFAAEAQLEAGATVDLSVDNGRLLVRPLRVREYSLKALLRRVSRRNLHGEVSPLTPAPPAADRMHHDPLTADR